MKKMGAIKYIILIAIVVVLCSCATASSSSKTTESTNSSPVNVEENWDLYQIAEESPYFSTAINTNPIDLAYSEEKNTATTTKQYLELEKKYLVFWQEELVYSLNKLLPVLTKEDAVRFQCVQEDWENNVEADLQLINDILYEESYQIVLGSATNSQILSEKRELYRERTIKIKYIHYLIESKAGCEHGALQSLIFEKTGDGFV